MAGPLPTFGTCIRKLVKNPSARALSQSFDSVLFKGRSLKGCRDEPRKVVVSRRMAI
jgi:hypothetical protein